MKHCFLYLICIGLTVVSCRKSDTEQNLKNSIQKILKDSLSSTDFATIDFASIQTFSLSNSSHVTRIGFEGKDMLHEFILLCQDSFGHISNARIVHIDGNITQASGKNKLSFNGHIALSSLNGENKINSNIENGFIMSFHTLRIKNNGIGVNESCSDCTIPEVVVSASYPNTSVIWGVWMSFLGIFNYGNPNDYLLIDYSSGSGGGGGGGSTPPPAITIDN